MRPVLISVAFMCLISSPAGAWSEAGHRLTAEIAFGLLNREQQHRVAEILRAHPRFKEDFASLMPDDIAKGSDTDKARWILAHASTWPDLVQTGSELIRQKYHYSTWHYINLPVYLTERDEAEFAGQLDHNMSMDFAPPLRRNLNIVQALKGNLLVWRDASARDADKAMALCWILHLASDLHEPMHVVALYSSAYFPEGDRGGNLIGIRRGKDLSNLHAVWDGLANGFVNLAPDDQTRDLLANDVADIESIPGWARHHRDMAEELAYTEEVKRKLLAKRPGKRNPVITLSRDYIATAKKFAETQVIIAGHRIAALISN